MGVTDARDMRDKLGGGRAQRNGLAIYIEANDLRLWTAH